MTFRPTILLFRGMALIRWQTRSEYGHCSIRTAPDEVIEASTIHGVQSIPAESVLKTATEFDITFATQQQLTDMADFARAQIGKPYDWLGCARFLSRSPESALRWQDSWFCSELVFAAALAGGIHLLERIPAWKVSPGMLAYSPQLTPVSTAVRLADSLKHTDLRVSAFKHIAAARRAKT